MGIVIRQSIKTTVVSYLGFAIGYVNTLFLFPLVLSKEQIGLTRLLISVSFLFATFASLGSGNIPTKFFPYFKDEKKQHNGILSFLLSIGLMGFILFVIIFILLKDVIFNIYSKNSPLLLEYFYYFIPFTLIVVLTTIFESYLIVQQKPIVPAFVREILMRLLIMVGLTAIYFGFFTFTSFASSIVIYYLLGLFVLILYIKREKILFLKPNFQILKSPHFKEMLVFAGFVIMGNASATIIVNIDSLMLSACSGLGSAGIYTIAFFIAAVIEIPKRSISQVVIPIVSQANKDGDIPKLKELYQKTSLNQLIVGGLIFLGIWCNIDNVFKLIPNGSVYAQGKWVVFFIGLSKLFDMATGVNQEIVGTSRYYKLDLVFYLFLVVIAVISNYIFIPLYGITGAAIASAISIFLFNAIRYSFLLYVFKIQPFSFNTLKVVSVFLVTLLTSYLILPFSNFIVDLIVRSLIVLVLFGGLVLLFKISEDVQNVINSIISRIKKFF
ncbi:MAG: oligosaccharide flippase family protein [Ignavibacteriales bacterium]|nr:oligosaccharide flippase family protein [Ignavibacteriales bacterium]